MTVPGSNLLKQALRVILRQKIRYYRAIGRTLNGIGQFETTYAPIQEIYGSFQPVPRTLYQQFGLDFTKDYFMFYSLDNIHDIQRDISNDQIQYEGWRFQCEANNAWYAQDRWKGVLCCRINVPMVVVDILGFNEIPSINNYVNFFNGNFYNDG